MTEFQNTGQPDWDWWRELWPDPTSVLQQFEFTEGQSVADVCSGNGYFALPAANLVGDAPVYAIDLDATLLAELRSRAVEKEIENVHAIRGKAQDVGNLLSHPVEVVLLANTFHGIADKKVFAEEVEDKLVPHGQFIIVNWQPYPREKTPVSGKPRGPPTDLRLSPQATTDIVESVGFEECSLIELPPYHYGLIFERTRR